MRGEAKSFVKAEKRTGNQLVFVLFNSLEILRENRAVSQGEKRAKQRNQRKDGKQIQSKGN